MSAVAAKPAPRRRRGLRWIVVLVVIVVVVGGLLFWLNLSASASTNAVAVLNVFLPVTSVAHNGGAYDPATTGSIVQPGDGVKTDAKGRAAIQFPDGTLTRLASDTEMTLTSAHFAKDGNLHDTSIAQKLGRTFTNVQHLVSGATYKVSGQSATATVRGTKFEVYIKADGTMIVKLFAGQLDFVGKNTVHLVAPQQATADPQGSVGPAGPILPDPDDPFGPELAASDASAQGTTPGTEQDYIGPPLHNGEQQQVSYSFAGGGLVKAALGYPGSVMKLQVKAPGGRGQQGARRHLQHLCHRRERSRRKRRDSFRQRGRAGAVHKRRRQSKRRDPSGPVVEGPGEQHPDFRRLEPEPDHIGQFACGRDHHRQWNV